MTKFFNPRNSYPCPQEIFPSEPITAVVDIPSVLIVEDNSDNAFLAQYISESLGFHTIAVERGQDALHQLKQQRFDLVLLDILLPDMDGLTVLQEIRQQFPTQQIPVVAVTAMAYRWQQQQILEVGFDDYLCKPYTIDGLESLLLKYCSCNQNKIS